jgi:hypothetical protein
LQHALIDRLLDGTAQDAGENIRSCGLHGAKPRARVRTRTAPPRRSIGCTLISVSLGRPHLASTLQPPRENRSVDGEVWTLLIVGGFLILGIWTG